MLGWFKKRFGGAKERDALLVKAEERLVTLIPNRVKALGIREAVYCLRIWYYGTDTVGDRTPTLMLPKESLRRRLVAKKGPKVPHYLWCADELTHIDWAYTVEIKDATVGDLCRKWYDYPWGRHPETEELRPAREMVQRVAKRLNILPWAKHVPVTDDFVVFAADGSHTFCNDYEEMQASVPNERIELLRTRRFLGTEPWWSLEPPEELPE
jgi:hypothetical protein